MTDDDPSDWRGVVSLALLSVVWASMRWNVLTGLVTDGPTVVDSLDDAAILAMLAITLGAMGYAANEMRTG